MLPHQLIHNMIKSKKFLLLSGVLSALLAVTSLLYEPVFYYFVEMFGINISQKSFSITLFFFAIFSLSLIYLQSGGQESNEEHESYSLALLLKELQFKISKVNEKINDLDKKLAESDAKTEVSEKDRESVISGAIEHISQEAIKEMFEREAKNLRESIENSVGLKRLTDLSDVITRRLRREITDLRLRSNINLLIGMVITGGGLYLLWTTVSIIDSSELLKQLASEGDESNYKFIKNIVLPIIPRVLLVIFIEVFAYFFLKLYKNGLSEIKYFQNELTNVESKLAAVEFSYMTNNPDGLKTSIESLSKTERNFILDKGQTTVELERAKSESELTRNIIKTIPTIFKNSKK